MLSYDEALARILNAASGPLEAQSMLPKAAAGYALAADVYAPADLPPFSNSAVDGFAVRLTDVMEASANAPVVLRVTQTIAAGYASDRPVETGEAARILTGAPVPLGTDGIVMVEDTRPAPADADGAERIALLVPASGRFIRAAGSDIATGTLALRAGTTIDAGAVGLLSALNFECIPCVRRARVAILTTGDEVVPPGSAPLLPGQMRDANGPALAAAVREAKGAEVLRLHARDTEAEVRAAFDACVRKGVDVVVASGGVSVGEFDYVKKVAGEMGTLDFWRIAVKPGKPLAFGKIGSALFFGLPGNPVSSLVTFELFVRPALRKMGGFTDVLRPVVTATLTENLPHETGRREFVRARAVWSDGGYQATPMGAQGSHRLASLAGADAYLVAREERGDYEKGESLSALLFRQ